MTGITMFDTILNDQFPSGAAAYAAYVDGSLGNQPNYAYIVSAFPKAQHLSIALFAANNADVLDVEAGASVPAEIPGWYARQAQRGIARPVIYANAFTMETAVRPVIASLPGGRAAVRLWTAHYGLGEHICGPRSCGQLSIDADGTQWTSSAHGLVLDQSLLRADFFGGWIFSAVRQLTLLGAGPHSVKASWQSPGIPAPEAVGWYEVIVRHLGQDIGSPVYIAKGANPQVYQWNNLTPATQYEFWVRAMTAGKKHASPWAVLGFKTAKAQALRAPRADFAAPQRPGAPSRAFPMPRRQTA